MTIITFTPYETLTMYRHRATCFAYDVSVSVPRRRARGLSCCHRITDAETDGEKLNRVLRGQ